jgi:YHS domain-containing protein
MMVDEKRTKFVSSVEGKNFYFCSAACKSTFDKYPSNYARK